MRLRASYGLTAAITSSAIVHAQDAQESEPVGIDFGNISYNYECPQEGVYAPCPCGSGKKWKFCHKPKAKATSLTIGYPRFETPLP